MTTRWGQLIFGIICMVMIANLQYGWTLFVNPIDQKYHWGRAGDPGRLHDLRADRNLAGADRRLPDRQVRPADHGLRSAACWSPIAWVINSVADSLFLLYVGAAIGGIGAGVIYGGSVGNALKWFPDRRGLAAGLTAAGFGAGSALTVVPIANMIQSSGYRIRLPLVRPRAGHRRRASSRCCCARRQPARSPAPAAPAVQQTRRDYTPGRGAQDAGVLGHVRDVRHGRRRRPDGDRAARADRQRTSRSPAFRSRSSA